MGFEPNVEINYLKRLSKDIRRDVLVEELATAVGEANRFSFQKTYRWQDMVIDERSGEPVGAVVARGGRAEETIAWGVIEPALTDNNNLVVNISPANENFGYPCTVVDFYQRNENVVTWSRATIEDSFETVTEVYERLGGETVTSCEEMLAKPIVVTDLTPEQILDNLHIIGESVKITQKQIGKVAEIIVDDFINKFGHDFVLNKDRLFRAYSAVMAEVKNIVLGNISKVVDRVKVEASRLYDYAFLPMINAIQKTYGCDNQTMVGSFVNGVRSMVGMVNAEVSNFLGEKTFDCPKCKGKIPSGKGIETCPHCGMTKQEAGGVCD